MVVGGRGIKEVMLLEGGELVEVSLFIILKVVSVLSEFCQDGVGYCLNVLLPGL